jgi:MFS family permease
VLCLVQFVDVLGVTVVITALPEMLAGVGAGPSGGGFVATGYAVFFGGLLMFGARVGDRWGHRRTILWSLAGFGLGALLGAVAQSLLILTAARCLQGAASAAAVPSALRLLTSAVTGEKARAKALAAWSAAGAAAGASGLVLGGTVTAIASWRYVFWALLVVAAVLAPAVLRSVPADGASSSRQTLNVVGSGLLTLSVMAVVSGATIVSEPGRVWLGTGLLTAAVLLALAFVYADRRSSAPLLPRNLVRQRPLRRGAVGAFVNTATTSSVATLATLHVQDTLGESPLATAAMLLPLSLLVIAGSGIAARILPRVRPESLTAAGLALIASGFGLMVLAEDQLLAIAGCMALAGVGLGLSAVATTSLGTDVPEDDRTTASGIINTTAQLGTAIGVAALLLAAAATTGMPGPGVDAPTTAWVAAAALAGLAALAFVVLGRRSPAGGDFSTPATAAAAR